MSFSSVIDTIDFSESDSRSTEALLLISSSSSSKIPSVSVSDSLSSRSCTYNFFPLSLRCGCQKNPSIFSTVFWIIMSLQAVVSFSMTIPGGANALILAVRSWLWDLCCEIFVGCYFDNINFPLGLNWLSDWLYCIAWLHYSNSWIKLITPHLRIWYLLSSCLRSRIDRNAR